VRVERVPWASRCAFIGVSDPGARGTKGQDAQTGLAAGRKEGHSPTHLGRSRALHQQPRVRVPQWIRFFLLGVRGHRDEVGHGAAGNLVSAMALGVNQRRSCGGDLLEAFRTFSVSSLRVSRLAG